MQKIVFAQSPVAPPWEQQDGQVSCLVLRMTETLSDTRQIVMTFCQIRDKLSWSLK
ncbi:hypothetical protein JCM17380_29220 [Desulfosporosinus burensis]